MKKIISLVLLVLVLVLAGGMIALTGCQQETVEKYYKVTYKASYNTAGVIKEQNNYEVVENKERLKEILDKIKDSKYKKILNEDYFQGMNLLVVEGGIGTEVKTMEVSNKKVDVLIYYASPLATEDEEHSFDLYLIPIEKDLKDINVERTIYPDRIY